MVCASLAVTRVPFRDGFILAASGDYLNPGDRPVILAPVCDVLALTLSPQLRKLKATKWACVINMIMQLPGDVQAREMATISLRALPMWLATINPGKVKPRARPMLVAYQQEAADVLYQHFAPRMTGQATVDDMAATLVADVTRLSGDVADMKTALAGLLARLTAEPTTAPAPAPVPVDAPTTAPLYVADDEQDKEVLFRLFKQQEPTWGPRIREFFERTTEAINLYGPDASRAITSTEAFHEFSLFATRQGWGAVHRYVFNVVMKDVAPRRLTMRYKPTRLGLAWVTPPTETPATDAAPKATPPGTGSKPATPAPTTRPAVGPAGSMSEKERLDIIVLADLTWALIQRKTLTRILPTDIAEANRKARPALRARVALDLLCTRGLLRRRTDGAYEPVPVRPRTSLPPALEQEAFDDVRDWLAEETRPPTRDELNAEPAFIGMTIGVVHRHFVQWAKRKGRVGWTQIIVGRALLALGVTQCVWSETVQRTAYLLWLRARATA